MDVADAPRWQAGLTSLTVTDHNAEGLASAADIEIDAKIRMMRAKVAFTYEPLSRLHVSQLSGDLKSIDTGWELADLGDEGTHVRYYAAVDLGRVGLLIRGPVVERLRQQLAGARCQELQQALSE